MSFPETTAELSKAGYRFMNEANCRGCGSAIEWWETPRGKRMPMDVDASGNAESHWANCPDAKQFRKD